MKNTEIKRRNFFKTVGQGAFAASILSFVPFKAFSSSKKDEIKVEIHPASVKRTKRVK